MGETSIQFETPEEEAAFLASIEEARQSMRDGHWIDLEDVAPWLLSWGSDNELPPPECK